MAPAVADVIIALALAVNAVAISKPSSVGSTSANISVSESASAGASASDAVAAEHQSPPAPSGLTVRSRLAELVQSLRRCGVVLAAVNLVLIVCLVLFFP